MRSDGQQDYLVVEAFLRQEVGQQGHQPGEGEEEAAEMRSDGQQDYLVVEAVGLEEYASCCHLLIRS